MSARMLRAHLPELSNPQDGVTAQALIDNFPQRVAATASTSPLYDEALRIQEAAFYGAGSVEERIAALARARQEIWAIADRAPQKESAVIRSLTRMLEHVESSLTDPPFEFQDPGNRSQSRTIQAAAGRGT